MAERSKAAVLKTVEGYPPPRVRIPASPPNLGLCCVINVLLVDDHDLVRTGIKMMLSEVQGIRVSAEAASGEDAIRACRAAIPDVVLMDVKMPGIGGFEATRKLLRMYPDLKILIVTICNNDIYPARLIQAGASGYLTKGASMEEMVQAIRAVHSGQRYISPEIAARLALKHLNDDEESPFEQLSEREMQVMMLIIKAVRVQEIAEKLCLSPKTVNSYRYRIFEKLKIDSDVELTLLALKHGLIEQDDILRSISRRAQGLEDLD